ncbi:hypothetical protein D3C84_644200 [compost metagenome]
MFRADQHVHRNRFVLEQLLFAGQVRGFAHPGDLGRRVEQGVGDLAGDHVGFIAAGHGDQHVCVVGTGLTQHGRERTSTLNRADVQPVTKVSQAFAIGVDHGDVVRFARQVFGQRTADLPCSEDDDFHPVTPLNPFNRARRRS